MKKRDVTAFQKIVYAHYAKEGRDLPWRHTQNPYHILVSEVMLQQTQVDRVIPKYTLFLKTFRTARALARAPLSRVLGLWQGLGYNRRGKFLHEAANMITKEYRGTFPKTPELIERLPGVGHYTARAISAFAYNTPEVFIETNIRTVFLHHFFKNKSNISDTEVLTYIEETLDKKQPRIWYWGLMDYGSYLKKEIGNQNRRSAHYTTQSKFEGSNRQIRGLIIKTILSEKSITAAVIARKIRKPIALVRTVAETLVREGLITKVGNKYIC